MPLGFGGLDCTPLAGNGGPLEFELSEAQQPRITARAEDQCLPDELFHGVKLGRLQHELPYSA